MPKRLLRWAAAAAAVLALCAVLLGAFELYIGSAIECVEHSKSQSEHRPAGNANTPSSASVKHLVPADSSKKEPAEPKDHYYECLLAKYTLELAKVTKILAFATALLFFVTGGLVVLGYRQEAMARTHERAYVFGGGPMWARNWDGSLRTVLEL
jgi:hypothetical protein